MISLVHVGRPETRHIMALAMGVPAIRESRWGYCPMDDRLSRVVGGHASRWILARRGDRDIQLIWTRNYVARQTNLHAHWLLFQTPELADEFLRSSPRFNVGTRLERLEHERRELAEKVEARLRRGGFDLSKIAPEQRWAVAHRFIKAEDKLKDLARHCEHLKIADGLRKEWISIL